MLKEQLSTNSHLHQRTSLNPCFSGTCSKRFAVSKCNAQTAQSLNPCFSGTCSKRLLTDGEVSALVWGLNPCFSGTCSKSRRPQTCAFGVLCVLILVLVEHAQRAASMAEFNAAVEGLTPCFSGTCSKSEEIILDNVVIQCFVLILVLVEHAQRDDGVKGVSGQPITS